MPILKTFTAPNGVTVTYHRLGQVEGRFPDLVAQVHSWVDRDAYLQGMPPAFVSYAPFNAEAWVAQVEQAALGLQDLTDGTLTAETDGDLEAGRVRRWAAIKAERDRRDFGPITFGQFEVDADQQSRMDIMGALMSMQITGQASRLWRCADNVMRQLTAAELGAVGAAIAARRQGLIETSDALYQQIQAAQTSEAVQAVTWPA